MPFDCWNRPLGAQPLCHYSALGCTVTYGEGKTASKDVWNGIEGASCQVRSGEGVCSLGKGNGSKLNKLGGTVAQL